MTSSHRRNAASTRPQEYIAVGSLIEDLRHRSLKNSHDAHDDDILPKLERPHIYLPKSAAGQRQSRSRASEPKARATPTTTTGGPDSQPKFAHIVVDDSITRDDLLQAQLSDEDAMVKVQKMIHLYCFGFESLVQEITAAAGNPEALQSKLRSVFTDAVGQIFKNGHLHNTSKSLEASSPSSNSSRSRSSSTSISDNTAEGDSALLRSEAASGIGATQSKEIWKNQARSLGREVESLLAKHAAQKYSLEQFECDNDKLRARVRDLEKDNSKLEREVSYLAEEALTARKSARQITMMNKENMDLRMAIENGGNKIKDYSTQMSDLRREIRLHKESERLEYERLKDDKAHEDNIMRMYHQLNEIRELEALARKDAETSNRIVQLRDKELNRLQKMFNEKEAERKYLQKELQKSSEQACILENKVTFLQQALNTANESLEKETSQETINRRLENLFTNIKETEEVKVNAKIEKIQSRKEQSDMKSEESRKACLEIVREACCELAMALSKIPPLEAEIRRAWSAYDHLRMSAESATSQVNGLSEQAAIDAALDSAVSEMEIESQKTYSDELEKAVSLLQDINEQQRQQYQYEIEMALSYSESLELELRQKGEILQMQASDMEKISMEVLHMARAKKAIQEELLATEGKRAKLEKEYRELVEIKEALEKLYADMKADFEAKIEALINAREIDHGRWKADVEELASALNRARTIAYQVGVICDIVFKVMAEAAGTIQKDGKVEAMLMNEIVDVNEEVIAEERGSLRKFLAIIRRERRVPMEAKKAAAVSSKPPHDINIAALSSAIPGVPLVPSASASASGSAMVYNQDNAQSTRSLSWISKAIHMGTDEQKKEGKNIDLTRPSPMDDTTWNLCVLVQQKIGVPIPTLLQTLPFAYMCSLISICASKSRLLTKRGNYSKFDRMALPSHGSIHPEVTRDNHDNLHITLPKGNETWEIDEKKAQIVLKGLSPKTMDKLRTYAVSNKGTIASGSALTSALASASASALASTSASTLVGGIGGTGIGPRNVSFNTVPPPRFRSILWDRKVSIQIDKLSRLSTISGISNWLQKRQAREGRRILTTPKKNHLDASLIETQGVRPVVFGPQYLQDLLRRSGK